MHNRFYTHVKCPDTLQLVMQNHTEGWIVGWMSSNEEIENKLLEL